MPRSRPYKKGLNERLKDPEHVAAYLNAAAKESRDVFMLALRDVAEAHKISRVAIAAKVNRETLYRTLSARGNPTFATFESILKAVGIETYYRARVKRKRATPACSESASKGSEFFPNATHFHLFCSGLLHSTAQSQIEEHDSGTARSLPERIMNANDGTVYPLSPFWINDQSQGSSSVSVNP